MKTTLKTIGSIILLFALWFFMQPGPRYGEDGEMIQKAAKPVVEALALYLEKHGKLVANDPTAAIVEIDVYTEKYGEPPKSIEDVTNMPYSIYPCKQHQTIYECKMSKSSHFFKLDNEYFTIQTEWKENDHYSEPDDNIYDLGLRVTHWHTQCEYKIFENGKIKEDYLKPDCGATMRPNSWKQ